MEQILNLINKDKSEIKYDIINFSDGESHIKFTSEVNRKYPVTVCTRISSWNDLMILMQVGDILNRMEVDFDIYIKYLLTMRMDRVISFNEAYSLKITANLINSLGAKHVTIVEPHSSKTLDLINNSSSIDMIHIWKDKFIKNLPGRGTMLNVNHAAVVFPDAGAANRYAKAIGSCVTVIICKKVRDPNTGELKSFEIANPDVINDNFIKEFVVIDDLCDNGGTFIGIANLLKKYDIKRSIAVTHMVNPNGIKNLSEHYDNVVITNSYKNWEDTELPDNVEVLDI